ncbi:MAG: MFS transporter, partial [Chloroflexota bacterium]|nr:MFS transporter [Chloroflexota bacterium]
IIAFTVPAILFAAIAGVFVERNSKKTMLVLTNLARGVLVLAYLLSDSKWGAGAILPIFYTVTFVFASVSQFFNPAEASMIPLMVKPRELVPANSLFNLTLTATTLGGFVLLGPLLLATVLHNNFSGLYLIIFVLCMAAAALTYFLPQDQPGNTATARRQRGEKVDVGAVATGAKEIAKNGFRAAWDELVEGWMFIRRDSVIMSAIVYWSIAIAVFMVLGTVGPGFLNRVLHLDSSQLIYILLPGGVGMVIGVLLVGRISHPGNRQTMINRSLLAAGGTLLVFAAVEPFIRWMFGLAHREPPGMLMLALMGLLTLLLGIFNSFISVPAQTALQERSPQDIRARVFSAFYTVSNAIIILPVPIAGALADRVIGYPATVAAVGVLVLIVAGIGVMRTGNRGKTTPLSNGYITPEEATAALTAATPAPRPIPAFEQQKEPAEHK